MINKKAAWVVTFSLFITGVVAPIVHAQQTTTTTVPKTRNPQTTRDVLDATSGIQQPSTEEALTSSRPSTISVPAGEPAASPASSAEEEANSSLWVLSIGLILVALVAGWGYVSLSKKKKRFATDETHKDEARDMAEKPVEEQIRQQKAKSSKKTSKKRRRRTKNKKTNK